MGNSHQDRPLGGINGFPTVEPKPTIQREGDKRGIKIPIMIVLPGLLTLALVRGQSWV